MPVDPIQLTRQLVEIESTSGNEGACGAFLETYLRAQGYRTDRIPVPGQPHRFNVYAIAANMVEDPDIVLSTHMDTVPPYVPLREDDENLYGRGTCDAKGIIAAETAAAEHLRNDGVRVALLFLVGEELDSAGAKAANLDPRGSRFMINGEPTESRVALASKGTLRLTLTAHGKMAHSAYPELGDSAVHKLVAALADVLKVPLPTSPDAGPCTLNIGKISGGYAPNVIADKAEAKVLVRLIGPSKPILDAITAAVAGRVSIATEPENPFIRFDPPAGFPTMVASFATDVPSLSAWGKPVLFGPGSIHVAHTPDEKISKRELLDSVGMYVKIAKQLLGTA
jgi:acetylornithine deacetylase